MPNMLLGVKSILHTYVRIKKAGSTMVIGGESGIAKASLNFSCFLFFPFTSIFEKAWIHLPSKDYIPAQIGPFCHRFAGRKG